MNIKHFDIQPPITQPPNKEEWEPTWHGYWELTECETESRRLEYKAMEEQANADGIMTEIAFERDCLLSILSEIKSPKIRFMELGAGWGRISLALAGVIDHKPIPDIIPTEYFCVAVEAEPNHYLWLREHFKDNKIHGIVKYGAVSNKFGKCRFDINAKPNECYGQAITPFRPWNVPISGVITVPTYSVDWLIHNYSLDHVDIIDVDVQGEEYKTIQGASDSIEGNKIDYFMIGTHDKKYNKKIAKLLKPKYDLIVDILPNTLGNVEGFPPIKCHDGIQLYKRKGL